MQRNIVTSILQIQYFTEWALSGTDPFTVPSELLADVVYCINLLVVCHLLFVPTVSSRSL